MPKLVFAICLLNVAVPMRDESMKGEANTKRSGENCSQKQLRSVDYFYQWQKGHLLKNHGLA